MMGKNFMKEMQEYEDAITKFRNGEELTSQEKGVLVRHCGCTNAERECQEDTSKCGTCEYWNIDDSEYANERKNKEYMAERLKPMREEIEKYRDSFVIAGRQDVVGVLDYTLCVFDKYMKAGE